MYTKSFNHPVHCVRYFQNLLKRALREIKPPQPKKPNIPSLSQELGYYMTYETYENNDHDKIYLGICFFAQDGEIIFCSHNPMPVSLWRWRRQGEARSATMLEGQIKTTFRQKFIPLVSETPYLKVDDGLYQCKINWGRYQAQFLGL